MRVVKGVLIVLVIVNLALLVWGVFGGDKVEATKSLPVKQSGGEKLVLLRELAEEEVVSLQGISALAGGQDPSEDLCIFIGQFKVQEKSEAVVERLAAWDIQSSAEDVEVPVGKGYWVYLAPEVSRPVAMRKLKELQSRGLDSYVIPRGNLEHGISFGVFSSEQRAQALQERVLEEGYQALLAEIERTEKQRWVVIPAEVAAFVNDMVWEKVKEIEANIEREKRYCLGVAPEDNIQ